jgi:hypothetical protein
LSNKNERVTVLPKILHPHLNTALAKELKAKAKISVVPSD